jgi:hypothetical protein
VSEEQGFKIIELDDLEQMSDEELVQYGIDSINAMMEFQLEYNKVDSMISNMVEIDLEHEIVKEAFDFSRADEGIFKAPYYDEQVEQPRLKNTYFGGQKTHERGTKIKIISQKEVFPFGLVNLTTKKLDIGRKTNDVHYEDLKIGRGIDEKLFIYDYDFEETLKKHKESNQTDSEEKQKKKVYPFVERPNKKPREKDDAKKFKGKQKMYDDRKDLLDAAQIRWMDFSSRYVDSHEPMFNELYSLMKETDREPTLSNYSVFFNVCKSKLEELKEKIGVKVCLSHTDMETYEFLLAEMSKYIEDLKELDKAIYRDLILSDEEFQSLNDDRKSREKFGEDENLKELSDLQPYSVGVYNKMRSKVDLYLRFFIPFNEPRDKEKIKDLNKKFKDGFIIDDSSENMDEWRIYPTPFSIEKFRHHPKTNMTLDELNLIPKKILEKYKELKSR